jgi:hypothetical protein
VPFLKAPLYLPHRLSTQATQQRTKYVNSVALPHSLSVSPSLADHEQPAEPEVPNIISYLPDHGHLLCTPCRSVVPYKTLHHHLRHYHKTRSSVCKTILSQYEGLPVSQTDADVVPRANDSLALEFLAPPERGYFCPQCDQTTCSWDTMLLHFRKTQCSREQRTRNELSCLLQRWSPIRRNVGGTWRVGDATRTSQGEKRSSLDWSESDDPATVALLQMEAEEEARLLQQDRELMSLSNELEHDEKTN